MPDDTQQNKGAIRRFLDLPADSVPKTIFVAVALCLVASMFVSATTIALRPTQQINQVRDKQINILQVAGLYDPDADVSEAFASFEPQVLELETGLFVYHRRGSKTSKKKSTTNYNYGVKRVNIAFLVF